LRTYINYHYMTQAPFKILVATTIGVSTGVIGGLLGSKLPPTHGPPEGGHYALFLQPGSADAHTNICGGQPPHLLFIFPIVDVVIMSHP